MPRAHDSELWKVSSGMWMGKKIRIWNTVQLVVFLVFFSPFEISLSEVNTGRNSGHQWMDWASGDTLWASSQEQWVCRLQFRRILPPPRPPPSVSLSLATPPGNLLSWMAEAAVGSTGHHGRPRILLCHTAFCAARPRAGERSLIALLTKTLHFGPEDWKR